VSGLRARGLTFEVIVIENGSTDSTLQIAKDLQRVHREVRVMHRDVADYGAALRTGLLDACGDFVVNFDCDYYDLDFLDRALQRMRANDALAVVVGSKRADGARDERAWPRRLVTAVFSTILRVGFGLHVSDTHGMKVLRRASVEALARESTLGRDLFDTELVLRVERAGLATAEIPVAVHELRPARTSIVRRVPRTLVGLARLRWALR
jgi:glycosyltransferase involved in cell wall biosynthesis